MCYRMMSKQQIQDIPLVNIFYVVLISVISLILIVALLISCCVSCSGVHEMAKTVEDIATDTAIKVEVSRETIQKDTNAKVSVDVQNTKD
jgi:hypothetical protein